VAFNALQMLWLYPHDSDLGYCVTRTPVEMVLESMVQIVLMGVGNNHPIKSLGVTLPTGFILKKPQFYSIGF
jgi:hypothetical protein